MEMIKVPFKKEGLKNNDYIFDGFAHRAFDERLDGWMNALPDPDDYPAVQQARDVLAMFEEIRALRKENWHLQKELNQLKPLVYGATGLKSGTES
jgi:hypothetical protein